MKHIEKNCYHCEQIGPGVGKKSCGYMGDGKTALECLHYTPNALVKAMNAITEVLKEPVEHTPARVNHEFSVEVTAKERPDKNCCRCKSVQGNHCRIKRSLIGNGEQAATCKHYKYDLFKIDYGKLFQMPNDFDETIEAAKAKQKEKENTTGLTRKMKIICGERRSGKSTELIKRCANEGGYIVCFDRRTAYQLVQAAKDMELNIPLPITYDEFKKGQYYAPGIPMFHIDDVDMFLQSLTPVKIATITLDAPDVVLKPQS